MIFTPISHVCMLVALCSFSLLVEIVVGLSQSVFMAFEVNEFVTVCTELLEGRLERDVSVFLETVEGSGMSQYYCRFSINNMPNEPVFRCVTFAGVYLSLPLLDCYLYVYNNAISKRRISSKCCSDSYKPSMSIIVISFEVYYTLLLQSQAANLGLLVCISEVFQCKKYL